MLFTNVRIAIESLRSTRIRTALTTLGIVIGVASITMVLALGEGAKQTVARQVKELDENLIVIRPGKINKATTSDTSYNPLSTYAATTLTENDLETVRKTSNIRAVAPLMLINGSVKNEQQTAQGAAIVATSPELEDILQLEAAQGQFLDTDIAKETVVLGEELSVALFGTDQTIGNRVKIRGQDFTIVGVLKKTKNNLGVNGIDFNMAALVNLDAGKSFNQGIAQIQQISLQTTNTSTVPSVKESLNTSLLANHNGEDDFTVMSGKEIIDVSDNFFSAFTSIIAIVAGISLIVGGVGIMNSMLIGVAERTREIGIRKSVGASNRHIFSQFLIESLIMSLGGGIVGFIVAYVLAYGLSLFLIFQPALSLSIFGVAMFVSVVVGVVFGLFPALRAAGKDPITALRQHH